jgi:hypothetical protein
MEGCQSSRYFTTSSNLASSATSALRLTPKNIRRACALHTTTRDFKSETLAIDGQSEARLRELISTLGIGEAFVSNDLSECYANRLETRLTSKKCTHDENTQFTANEPVLCADDISSPVALLPASSLRGTPCSLVTGPTDTDRASLGISAAERVVLGMTPL